MSEQGIQIPKDTIVNGKPFRKYKELEDRIVELESMVAHIISDPPSIPDWIAQGKWVDCRKIDSIFKVKKVDGVKVFFGVNSYDWVHYDHCKPFTPPPCPELPTDSWRWDTDDILEVFGQRYSIDGAIVLLQVDVARCIWSQSSLDRLIEIRDWREKWGKG